MHSNEEIVLYTLTGCHLCEDAAAMLDRAGVAWRPVEIDESPELEERYGLCIPVIFSVSTKRELLYPFGEEQLSRFLEGLR